MPALTSHCLILIALCGLLGINAHVTFGQNSQAEFKRTLNEKAAFDENDILTLHQGQAIVKVLPPQNKSELSVHGLVKLETSADAFLRSFRDNMARKNSAAILEIGRLKNPPAIEDLRTLTIEDRDLEDLRECVVGSCRLKLSAPMIERLQKEVNWTKPDFKVEATRLFKQMLVDYVRDYLTRGEPALIEYGDKLPAIRMVDERRKLLSSSSFGNELLSRLTENTGNPSAHDISIVEDAIVWSKIKFGLRPVTAINHIVIYRRASQTGAQIMVASKQIYANHYFNSSLALTAFFNFPGTNPGSYLYYENRSQVDGLAGPFGKLKRALVENKAIAGLKGILEESKANLDLRSSNLAESAVSVGRAKREWSGTAIRKVLVFLVIASLFGLVIVTAVDWRRALASRARHEH